MTAAHGPFGHRMRHHTRERFDPHSRWGLRLTLIVLGVFVALVPLGILAVVIREHVGPVITFDDHIESLAHRAVVSSHGLLTAAQFVTQLGSTMVRIGIVVVVAAWLFFRRARRLAAYLVVTYLGGTLLLTILKAAVGRARPHLPDPVAHAHGASFPSGHAMGSAVLYGALVLIVAPLLGRAARWALATLAALLVLAIMASRVLLGVHYATDVIGGLVFGLAWLAVSTGLFTVWRRDTGRGGAPAHPLEQGLDPQEERRLTRDRAAR